MTWKFFVNQYYWFGESCHSKTVNFKCQKELNIMECVIRPGQISLHFWWVKYNVVYKLRKMSNLWYLATKFWHCWCGSSTLAISKSFMRSFVEDVETPWFTLQINWPFYMTVSNTWKVIHKWNNDSK